MDFWLRSSGRQFAARCRACTGQRGRPGGAKLLGLAVAAVVALGATAANATLTFNVSQDGANVVVTSSGSLDLSGLSIDPGFTSEADLHGDPGFVGTGVVGVAQTGYFGFTGPTTFGAGTGLVDASSSSGASVSLNATVPLVFVAADYSGGSLAGTATFDNATISSLGLETGAYLFTLPSDTIVVNIAGVPEPAAWAMLVCGFGLIGARMRRRRTSISFA